MIHLALAATLALCPAQGVRVDCVVDGDTLWLGREKARIANIDTPELHSPKCPSERALAIAARNRLHALLQTPFVVWRGSQDRYGRTLVRITVEGRDVGEVLVAEKHARPYRGKREPWC